MPESELPKQLSDEERIQLEESYKETTEEFSETQRQYLIDHGYGDPALWTKETDERNFGKPVSNADLPALIRERSKRWGKLWNKNS